MRTARSVACMVLAACLAACSSETQKPADPAAAPTAPAPANPGPAPAPANPAPAGGGAKVWAQMNHGEREAHMKQNVMPAMREAFAKWEPDEFKDMKCGVCHGKDAKAIGFKMPNPNIDRLPKTPEGWKALEEKEPHAMEFMKSVVVPKMAALLGEKPYDPATHQGFGCMRCHMTE